MTTLEQPQFVNVSEESTLLSGAGGSSVTTVSHNVIPALQGNGGGSRFDMLSAAAAVASVQQDQLLWPLRNVTIGLKTHDYARLLLCCVHKTVFDNEDVLAMSYGQHYDAAFNGAAGPTLSAAVKELLRAREMRYGVVLPNGHIVAIQHDWVTNGTSLDFQFFNYCNQTHKRNMALRWFGSKREECVGVFTAMSTWVNHESADLQVREQLTNGEITMANLDLIRITSYKEHDPDMRKAAGIKYTGRTYVPFSREVVPKYVVATGALDVDACPELAPVTEKLKNDTTVQKLALRRSVVPKKRANSSPSNQAKRTKKVATPSPPATPSKWVNVYNPAVYAGEPGTSNTSHDDDNDSNKTLSEKQALDDNDDLNFDNFAGIDLFGASGDSSTMAAVRTLHQVTNAPVAPATMLGGKDDWIVTSMMGSAMLSLHAPKAKNTIACGMYNTSFHPADVLAAEVRSRVLNAPSNNSLGHLRENQPLRFYDGESRFPKLTIQHTLVSAETATVLKTNTLISMQYAIEVDNIIKRMIDERGQMLMTPGANVEQFTVAARQFGYTAEQVESHLRSIAK